MTWQLLRSCGKGPILTPKKLGAENSKLEMNQWFLFHCFFFLWSVYEIEWPTDNELFYLQMNWRICFREGWFIKCTWFLVLVDPWMVYIQPNRALRLLFQIFTTWPGFPQRAQYWFLPILPPGGKMCSGMIAKCKVQLKANRKKLSTRHLENVSAVELRWNWMQGSTTFGQTLPISDNLSACTLRRSKLWTFQIIAP